MRIQIPTFGAAIIFTVLFMGILGMFVLIPIACIQWTWNSLMTWYKILPLINVWQAFLLYLAFATVAYLTGLVRIEFEAEKLD